MVLVPVALLCLGLGGLPFTGGAIAKYAVKAQLDVGIVGWLATQGPEWSELILGIPTILGTYGWIIWKWGFKEEDRALFRKAKVID